MHKTRGIKQKKRKAERPDDVQLPGDGCHDRQPRGSLFRLVLVTDAVDGADDLPLGPDIGDLLAQLRALARELDDEGIGANASQWFLSFFSWSF